MKGEAFPRLSEFLLELYRDARQLEPQAFQLSMLERLAEFVAYDYAVWGGAEASQREVTDLVVLNQSKNLLMQWQEIGHRDSFCDLTLQRLNHTCLFDDVRDYRSSFAYNEHWRSFDVRHMISTIMNEPLDGYVSFVGLCNEDAARPFSEEDRLIKQQLMPHLSEALRLNREMALNLPEDEEGSALINRAGWILASRAPFDALVREEWGEGHRVRLPESFSPGSAAVGDWCGRQIAIQYRRFNDHYLLRARPLGALDRLAPRAQEVAHLYAAGFSHKEVARRLGIAPETVRKHLARIYSQLGITSKASLAGLVRRNHHNL